MDTRPIGIRGRKEVDFIKGAKANVIHLAREENDPNGPHKYIVEIRGSTVHFDCYDYTGAMVLRDIINRTVPPDSPILRENKQ